MWAHVALPMQTCNEAVLNTKTSAPQVECCAHHAGHQILQPRLTAHLHKCVCLMRHPNLRGVPDIAFPPQRGGT